MVHATSVHQSNAPSGEKVWGADFIHPYGDPDMVPSSVTNVTGSLFKVTFPYTLDIKSLPVFGIAGLHPLLDISSAATGNVIVGTSGDNYKMCIAYKVNECRTGSAVGDIYVNGPNVSTSSTCPQHIDPNNTTSDALCISNVPGTGLQNLLQIGLTETYSNGKLLRALTQGLAPIKQITDFANAQTSPDGKWISFMVFGSDGKQNVWQVKTPPWPGYDSIDRNTFAQKGITVPAFGGASEALIEFGYDTSFNCTSRRDVCVSASSNRLYSFRSRAFNAVSCASGCTVNDPVIPD